MRRMGRVKPSSVVYGLIGLALLAFVLNMVLGGGSSGDEAAPPLTDTGQPFAKALAARLVQPGDMWAGFTGLTEAQAACVAGPWVMIIGPDDLVAAEVQPYDFGKAPASGSEAAGVTWDEAQQIRREYERCGLDAKTLLSRASITAVYETGKELSVDQIVACMADKIDAKDADRAFVLTLTSPETGKGQPSAIPGFATPPTVDLDVNRALQNAAAECA